MGKGVGKPSVSVVRWMATLFSHLAPDARPFSSPYAHYPGRATYGLSGCGPSAVRSNLSFELRTEPAQAEAGVARELVAAQAGL